MAKRLDTIDVLRAVAAVGVVLGHIAHHSDPETNLRRALLLPLDLGATGVTLFLVISGFCIHLAASARSGGILVAPDWVAFWKRRMYRLYPAYLAAIVFSVLVYAFLDPASYPKINRIGDPAGLDLFLHAVMVQNLFERFPFSLGNGVFWTLALEEQLYALYAVYVILRRRYAATSLLAASLGITILWRLAVVVPMGSKAIGPAPLAIGTWWTWPFAWWFCWILGAVGAEAYVGSIRLPRWCSSLRWSAAVAVGGLLISPLTLGRLGYSHYGQELIARAAFWRLIFQGLPRLSDLAFSLCFFATINHYVQVESAGAAVAPLQRRASALGRMSYSLYLTHFPIVVLLETAVLKGSTVGAVALRYAVLVPTCILVASAFFWGVERRFLPRRNIPAGVPSR